eukprot:13757149-Alexandrium_andersonii.AAC.1
MDDQARRYAHIEVQARNGWEDSIWQDQRACVCARTLEVRGVRGVPQATERRNAQGRPQMGHWSVARNEGQDRGVPHRDGQR